MAYHPLPIYAQPPILPSLNPQSISSSLDVMSDVTSVPAFSTQGIWDGVRARSSLKQYFLHEVLEEINSEMKTLIEEKALWAEGSAVLTWTYIMAFSFMCTQGLIQKRALALWSIITMVAVGNENASHLLSI